MLLLYQLEDVANETHEAHFQIMGKLIYVKIIMTILEYLWTFMSIQSNKILNIRKPDQTNYS